MVVEIMNTKALRQQTYAAASVASSGKISSELGGAGLSRRQFLLATTLAATLPLRVQAASAASRAGTRGVVLYPFDLSLRDWPERCAKAGINTIALHAARRFDVLRDFVASADGQHFLRRCRELDLAVEYELHAMGELLSRELYYKNPSLFRVDVKGKRNPDANCCPHSASALDIIATKAVAWAKVFSPTTHRYYYWPDDGAQWCCCEKCRDFSASEQALLVENHIVKALRHKVNPQAQLSHISYHRTLAAPVRVKPEPGIFLEFAPIARDYTRPITDREAKTRRSSGQNPEPSSNRDYLDILEANLKLFGADTAQVLEYWLDVSMFSRWTRPAKKLPWDEAICRADIAAYRALGVRHITTFATYIDADYVNLHGDPQPVIEAYGAALGKP